MNITELNNKSYEVRYHDPALSLKLAEKAIVQAGKNKGSKTELAFGHINKAFAKFILSEDEGLLDLLFKALEVFQETENGQGLLRACTYIAQVNESYGNYDEGLKYALLAWSHKVSGTEREQADAAMCTGNIFFRLNDIDEALKFYKTGIRLRNKIKDEAGLASSWNLTGRALLKKGLFDQSLKAYEKSYKIRSSMGKPDVLVWTLLGMATVYDEWGKTREALKIYRQCLDLLEDNENLRCRLHVLIGKGKCHLHTGDLDMASGMMGEAMEIAENLQAKPLMAEIFALLAQLSEGKHDYKKTLEYLKESHRLKEEVVNQENLDRISKIQSTHEVREARQEAEIHRLKNIELKTAYEEIKLKNKEIEDSINYASLIQHAILPSAEDLKQVLPHSFIFYQPKDIVSGDFYWFSKVKAEGAEKIIVIVADCTGHGVPGALMSMIGSDRLNHIVLEKGVFRPSEILYLLDQGIQDSLNQKSEHSTDDGMELAACTIDFEAGTIEYAGAGRPLYIIHKDDSGQAALKEIKADNQSVGGRFKEPFHFTNHLVDFSGIYSVYMCSDGYPDQFGGANDKKFTTKRLKQLLQEIAVKPVSEQETAIKSSFMNWKEGDYEQTDDVLLMGILPNL